MVNDPYSDTISNAGSIYKYTIYLHNPHFTTPVRSPVSTQRFSFQNNPTRKFYIAQADSATRAHVTHTRRRGSNCGPKQTGSCDILATSVSPPKEYRNKKPNFSIAAHVPSSREIY